MKPVPSIKKQSKYLIICSLFVFGVLIIAFVTSKKHTSIAEMQSFPVEWDATLFSQQPTIGQKTAPIHMVEFGDYLCPACKEWGDRAFPILYKDYIEQGLLKFTYINVLWHGDDSLITALASESILNLDPDNFWNFHKALFELQHNNNHNSYQFQKISDLALLHSPRITASIFENELRNRSLSSKLAEDMQLVNKFAVKQTPTILINGKQIENPFDLKKLKSVIDYFGDLFLSGQ